MAQRFPAWFGGSSPETLFHRRWLARGLFVAVLLILPLALSIRSCLRPTPPRRILPLERCPPTDIVSLEEIVRYPARYRWQDIWTMGTLVVRTSDCLPADCQGKPSCCSPCRARLFLQEKGRLLPIRGLVDGKPLSCEASTCGVLCRPWKEGAIYAVSGSSRTSFQDDPTSYPPSFRLREFWVSHLCTPSDPASVTRFASLAEPLHRSLPALHRWRPPQTFAPPPASAPTSAPTSRPTQP